MNTPAGAGHKQTARQIDKQKERSGLTDTYAQIREPRKRQDEP